ncbi:7522_t:CDS:2, partial [Racocetra fulgida]
MELFSIGVSENTGRAISGHKSSGRYYAYTKPTDDHKREALANVLNKIITTPSSSSTEAFQDSINDSDSEADDYEDLQNNISEDDNDTSTQIPNEHEFYGNFHMANELLKNTNNKSQKCRSNFTNNENKRLH